MNNAQKDIAYLLVASSIFEEIDISPNAIAVSHAYDRMYEHIDDDNYMYLVVVKHIMNEWLVSIHLSL